MKAIRVGHSEIGDHEIERGLGEALPAIVSVLRLDHLEPQFLKLISDQFARFEPIINK
jgi:hypothetical protein